MNAQQIEELLKVGLPDAEYIAVEGDGGKFNATVVHAAFDGMRAVAKQQKVYALLQAHITSGAIHALSMRTLTPEEWRKAKLFG